MPAPTAYPDWVRWLAQDADGAWWGYSVEPNEADRGWYENEVGQRIRLRVDSPNPQWRETLQTAPSAEHSASPH